MNEEGQNCITLWRAVLSRAYDDCNPPKTGNWRTWRNANNNTRSDINTFLTIIRWIETKEFENVCDLADLNMEYIKKYFINHVLDTYNLMPENIKKKVIRSIKWLSQN